MKKVLLILLVLILCFSSVSCSKNKDGSRPNPEQIADEIQNNLKEPQEWQLEMSEN